MPRPDEGLIHEWLDGELPPEESERVARLVASDAEWSAAAAEARGLMAASSRILSALDAVPGGVLPAGSLAAPPARSRFAVRPWMRVAAALVLVAGTSYLVIEQDGSPATQLQRVSEESSAGPAAPTSTVIAPRRETLREVRPPVTVASADSVVPQAALQAAPRERRVIADATVSAGASGTSSGTSSGSASAGAAAPIPLPAVPDAASAAASATANTIVGEVGVTAVRQRAALARTEGADASRFAAKAAVARALEGCWRTVTAAGADTTLVTPAILASRGDTLVLDAGPAARPASVMRDADELRGTMADASGRRVTFRATRTECPSARPEDATPSPR